MSFKGREIVHSELGMNIMEGIIDFIGDRCIVEQKPRLEGYNIVMLIEPV